MVSGAATAEWTRLAVNTVVDLPQALRVELADSVAIDVNSVVVPECVRALKLHALAIIKQGIFFRNDAQPLLLFTFDDETNDYAEISAFLLRRGLAVVPSGVTADKVRGNIQDVAKRNALGAWSSICVASKIVSSRDTRKLAKGVGGIDPKRAEEPLWTMVAGETGVSNLLLYSIALRESGLGGKPHPWTINERGVARFFASKDEAVDYAKALIKRGENWFDVGYMQLHWKAHKGRFESIEAAFEPVTNVRAGAQLLREEYGRTQSVTRAVARYHRGGAEFDERARAYVRGVSNNFQKLSLSSAQRIP